ncbi:MAG: hypothetical protein H6Q96_456 [Nitrospirae bacterium]|nr:hypothetical protein [Nitrospirota bacterium]
MHGALSNIGIVPFIICALVSRASIVSVWRMKRAGSKADVKAGVSTLLRTATSNRRKE